MAEGDMPVLLDNQDAIQALLKRTKVFLFDCDGVIWRGHQVVPGAVEAIRMLQEQGHLCLFVTNSASRTRAQLQQRFKSFGFNVEQNQIFHSGYSSALYIKNVLQLPKDKRVFLIGQASIEEELLAQGLESCGGSSTAGCFEPLSSDMYDRIEPDPSIGAVLVSFDYNWNHKYNILKIAQAHRYLTDDPTIPLLTTNGDTTFPGAHGRNWPGGGTFVLPIAASTGRTPITIGKPERAMLDAIETVHQFDPAEACMIGDRLETDILFGKNNGMQTLLVLSGVTKKEELESDASKGMRPDYVMHSLADFLTGPM